MFSFQEVPTIFVDNQPIQIRKIWVHNLFSRFGKVRDVFIPFKTSKISGRKFGFVRFNRLEEASLAIANVDKTWRWDHLLAVKYARFLKNRDRQIYYQNNHNGEIQRNFPEVADSKNVDEDDELDPNDKMEDYVDMKAQDGRLRGYESPIM
ncbi:hypothetical protein Vadar_019745 [Vaccinium darrowii]|uniref:Uncharacterized protein n=1 Tax=Vaccinium darrowii TaxID=229202 RepID=A0ACB7X2I1_9ERIC|nr:hypothetical protein Vadar_019745 [Vaccinium darrowii]